MEIAERFVIIKSFLEELFSLFLKIVVIYFCVLGVTFVLEKTTGITAFTEIACVTKCHVEKIQYILSNLSPADEISLDNYIDKKIIEEFHDCKGQVSILDRKEYTSTYNEAYGHFRARLTATVGFYRKSVNTIYICDKGSIFDYSITLVHEFAHYLSFVKGYARDAKFDEIAERERLRMTFIAPYVATSVEEYRAETFAYYILMPDLLKAAAPETYAYHDREYKGMINE